MPPMTTPVPIQIILTVTTKRQDDHTFKITPNLKQPAPSAHVS